MPQELERPLPAPAPSDPASPDYDVRHAELVTDLGGGLTQLTVGHPNAELEAEPVV